jgi:hypothetical protein
MTGSCVLCNAGHALLSRFYSSVSPESCLSEMMILSTVLDGMLSTNNL